MRGADFAVSRFATEAVHDQNQEYWRRLDDAIGKASGKAVVVFDTLAPAAPGDRESVLKAVPHRRDEAGRRFPIAVIGFELPSDAELLRQVERQFSAFWIGQPRYEVRRDATGFVIKAHLECGVSGSPVCGRLPSYSLAGGRLDWRAGEGAPPLGSGSFPAPVIRPRPIEGGGPEPMRQAVEWRLPQPGAALFAVELRGPTGRLLAEHRATVEVKLGPGNRPELRVGPPPKPAPASAPAARKD